MTAITRRSRGWPVGRTGRAIGLGLVIALAGLGPLARPIQGAFIAANVDLALVPVRTGFDRPILVTNAADGSGRLFVVEQTGTIRTVAAGPSGTPFLDIRTRVVCCSERGLLGLAFHPGYETNGRLYVNYTRASDGATVIDEYRRTTNPNVVSAATRRQILVIAQPYPNHNGGGIAFGPDGFLYIGMGDGGSGGDPEDRAQDLNSLLGKMLRIDVDGTSTGKAYRIPPTNPYVGRTGLDEIWSIGLRNPWRWSFDRLTGDLWIGDVGQGRYEEVNRSPASTGRGRGVNYGWDDMEGRHCFEPMSGCATGGRTLPVAEYVHDVSGVDDNCSITGGHVYRGQLFRMLRGGYLFGDVCSGRIFAIPATATSAAPASPTLLLDTSLSIVSFGESETGELYLADLGGSILRVVETTRGPGAGAY